MELGQAHLVRVLNDQGVHVGDVDARLDDGGAHQHVYLPVGHPGHHAAQLLLAHLAVAHRHLRPVPQQLLNAGGGALYGVHPVVEVVHLAPTLQLPAHGVGQHRPVVLQHVGLHRLAVGGGLLDDGHVPDAGQGHVQGAGNGCGGQGEHVHLLGQLLEPFLVGDAEALLLVHHQKPQVLEAHVLLQQPVGADEQIHRAVRHPGQRLFHLGGGAEAGHHVDVDGVFLKPAQGGEVVLPG